MGQCLVEIYNKGLEICKAHNISPIAKGRPFRFYYDGGLWNEYPYECCALGVMEIALKGIPNSSDMPDVQRLRGDEDTIAKHIQESCPTVPLPDILRIYKVNDDADERERIEEVRAYLENIPE